MTSEWRTCQPYGSADFSYLMGRELGSSAPAHQMFPLLYGRFYPIGLQLARWSTREQGMYRTFPIRFGSLWCLRVSSLLVLCRRWPNKENRAVRTCRRRLDFRWTAGQRRSTRSAGMSEWRPTSAARPQTDGKETSNWQPTVNKQYRAFVYAYTYNSGHCIWALNKYM